MPTKVTSSSALIKALRGTEPALMRPPVYGAEPMSLAQEWLAGACGTG